MKRRYFLTTAGRYALYGALGVVAAASLKNAEKPSGKPCPAGISCGDCNLLQGCTLDEAEEARLSVNKEVNS